MGKIAFYVISLLVCVGMMSACSSDGDETDFSDGTELAIGGGEISSVTNVTPFIYTSPLSLKNDTCFAKCFHSEEEVRAYECLAPIYTGAKLVEIPPIDWDSQTLVLAICYTVSVKDYVGCKVIKKGDRYLVEMHSYTFITNDIRQNSAFIVVNKPKLTEDKFSVKSICSLRKSADE